MVEANSKGACRQRMSITVKNRSLLFILAIGLLMGLTGCTLISELLNPNTPPVANGECTLVTTSSVLFDASGSYDPDGFIQSYDWDFGDGAWGTGTIVTHIYRASGTYTATLTVTDNDGATDQWNCWGIEITAEQTFTLSDRQWIEEWEWLYWDLENVLALSFQVTASEDPVKIYVMDPQDYSEFRDGDSFYYYRCGSSGGRDVWDFSGQCSWGEPRRIYLVIYNEGDFDFLPDDAFITVEGTYTAPTF